MKQYLITDFGARTCDQLQTQAIQQAIDTCFLQGGGRVVIPAGVFRTGGLRLRSHVEIYLQSGAVLEGSTNPEDYTGWLNDAIEPIQEPQEKPRTRSAYPYSRWNNAIIRALYARNIAVTGEKGSFINGRNCYDPQGEEQYRGPHPINLWYCENVALSGYTVMDGGNWGHAIQNTQQITVRDVTVLGGHDGFDIRSCDDVLVENCRFYTGDDCIAGFDNHDVIVRDCEFDSACSAIRFGGHHVLFENCHSHSPSRFGFRGSLTAEKKAAGAPTDETCSHEMFAAFQYYCDFRAKIRQTPGDILLRHCTFENPSTVLSLNFAPDHAWCCNRSLASITFEDCAFTGVSMPMQIHGDEQEPLTLTVRNSLIAARAGCESEAVLDALHFEKIHFENVRLEGYETPAAILRNAGTVEIAGGTAVQLIRKEGLAGFAAR